MRFYHYFGKCQNMKNMKIVKKTDGIAWHSDTTAHLNHVFQNRYKPKIRLKVLIPFT